MIPSITITSPQNSPITKRFDKQHAESKRKEAVVQQAFEYYFMQKGLDDDIEEVSLPKCPHNSPDTH